MKSYKSISDIFSKLSGLVSLLTFIISFQLKDEISSLPPQELFNIQYNTIIALIILDSILIGISIYFGDIINQCSTTKIFTVSILVIFLFNFVLKYSYKFITKSDLQMVLLILAIYASVALIGISFCIFVLEALRRLLIGSINYIKSNYNKHTSETINENWLLGGTILNFILLIIVIILIFAFPE